MSSLNVSLWLHELKGDPDELFLSDGLRNGFQLVSAGARFQPAEMNNYRSVTDLAVRDKVEESVLEELAAGNYVISNSKPVIISALGAVPKPDSDEVRLIHDCSQPSGQAFNDYADIESFKYQSLEDALRLFKSGYYMAKFDLRHVYRSVHINPNNYPATGLKWKFKGAKKFTYFVDTRLRYGGRRAPGIFNRLTQAVKHMMASGRYKLTVVYLDDFLVLGTTWAESKEVFDCLIELLENLGFDINWRKVVLPTQCLTFLGVLIDTVSECLSLPQEKRVDLQLFVQDFLQKAIAITRWQVKLGFQSSLWRWNFSLPHPECHEFSAITLS